MASPNPGPNRRQRRRRAVLLVLLGTTLVTGLCLELGWRTVLRLQDRPWSQAQALVALDRVSQAISRLDWHTPLEAQTDEDRTLILHPFAGFSTPAAQKTHGRMAQEMQLKTKELFEIVVVGGSVSCLLVQHAGERLMTELQRDSPWRDRPMRLHLLGQGAMKQPQQHMIVSYVLALGWQPDLVINVDGFNEVALGYQNSHLDAHPVHPSASHWAHQLRGSSGPPEADGLRQEMLDIRAQVKGLRRFAIDSGALHSAVLGHLLERKAKALARTYTLRQRSYTELLTAWKHPSLQGPPFPSGKMPVLRGAARSWFESSVSLAAICRARDIHYLHVLQPTLHDTGSKPLTPGEIASGKTVEPWSEGPRVGYPILRLLSRYLPRRGVHFLDASQLFADVEEPLYYDPCHFNATGSEMLVDAIVAELRRQAN